MINEFNHYLLKLSIIIYFVHFKAILNRFESYIDVFNLFIEIFLINLLLLLLKILLKNNESIIHFLLNLE